MNCTPHVNSPYVPTRAGGTVTGGIKTGFPIWINPVGSVALVGSLPLYRNRLGSAAWKPMGSSESQRPTVGSYVIGMPFQVECPGMVSEGTVVSKRTASCPPACGGERKRIKLGS